MLFGYFSMTNRKWLNTIINTLVSPDEHPPRKHETPVAPYHLLLSSPDIREDLGLDCFYRYSILSKDYILSLILKCGQARCYVMPEYPSAFLLKYQYLYKFRLKAARQKVFYLESHYYLSRQHIFHSPYNCI